jgi:hypothetical protein
MGFVLVILLSSFICNEGLFDEGKPAMSPGAIEQIPSKPRERAKVKAFDPDAYQAKKERERKATKATGDDLDFDALQAAYDRQQAQLSRVAEAARAAAKAKPLPTASNIYDDWEAAQAAKAAKAKPLPTASNIFDEWEAAEAARAAAMAKPLPYVDPLDEFEAAEAARAKQAEAAAQSIRAKEHVRTKAYDENETEQGRPFNLGKWLSKHPYLAIYFLGSLLVIVLLLTKVLLVRVTGWITKDNVVAANLRKLQPPDETSFGRKVWNTLLTLALEAATSWIDVAVILYQILMLLLRFAREFVAPVPEAIKELRFPLKNNPQLSVEAVWAHLFALGIHNGNPPPDRQRLLEALDDACSNDRTFDRKTALRQLERLEVVKTDVLSATLTSVSTESGGE